MEEAKVKNKKEGDRLEESFRKGKKIRGAKKCDYWEKVLKVAKGNESEKKEHRGRTAFYLEQE